MINKEYYTTNNQVSLYLNGKVRHYKAKNPSKTVKWYNYELKKGETIYTLANKLFGEGLTHLWTYIADNNIPRNPDDWMEGDTIKLPIIIVKDLESNRTSYSNAETTSTTI